MGRLKPVPLPYLELPLGPTEKKAATADPFAHIHVNVMLLEKVPERRILKVVVSLKHADDFCPPFEFDRFGSFVRAPSPILTAGGASHRR